jgi:hypothetical protein
MTERQQLIRNLVALGLAIALGAWLSYCRTQDWEAEKDSAISRAERAERTAAVNGALAAEHEQRANREAVARRAAQDSARTARSEADRLRALRRPEGRPAPIVAPASSDTAAVRRALERSMANLDNCEAETVALRAAADQDATALTSAKNTENELRGSIALQKISIDSLMGALAEVTTSLASAEAPCAFLFWSCPSRKSVAIGSAVVTVAGTLFVLSLSR